MMEAEDFRWPPCYECGSDGFPADLVIVERTGDQTMEGDVRIYRCLDCTISYHRREGRERAALETAYNADEIIALRSDPASLSFRPNGQV